MIRQVTLNCLGCKQSVVDESGGLVVAFGQSFFHIDCFKCAKCHQKVAVDTELLLLSDGLPICTHCSYDCNVCHQPILDEAIMTGDDTYHTHCFNCKACHNRIDELVLAKTRSAIYCMTCHYKRMAKMHRHAQRKREREQAASGSRSSSIEERDAQGLLGEISVSDQSQAALSRRKSYDDSVQPDHSSMGVPNGTTFHSASRRSSINPGLVHSKL